MYLVYLVCAWGNSEPNAKREDTQVENLVLLPGAGDRRRGPFDGGPEPLLSLHVGYLAALGGGDVECVHDLVELGADLRGLHRKPRVLDRHGYAVEKPRRVVRDNLQDRRRLLTLAVERHADGLRGNLHLRRERIPSPRKLRRVVADDGDKDGQE